MPRFYGIADVAELDVVELFVSREGAERFLAEILADGPGWKAARTGALGRFIEYALGKGDVWFARRIDIAEWWLAHRSEWVHG